MGLCISYSGDLRSLATKNTHNPDIRTSKLSTTLKLQCSVGVIHDVHPKSKPKVAVARLVSRRLLDIRDLLASAKVLASTLWIDISPSRSGYVELEIVFSSNISY